jgi:hypothetical protein
MWGARGLAQPFPVSRALVKILTDEERAKSKWALLKYTSETILTIVALTYLTRKFSPLLTSQAGRYAKYAGIFGLAAYGGYRGYKHATQENADTGDDEWHRLQTSIESTMELRPNDTETFYSIAYDLEKNIYKFNASLVTELEPAIEQARELHGSLDGTRRAMRSKIAEIDQELAQRKKVNK